MAHMMTRMTRITHWLDSHDSLARWLAGSQLMSRPLVTNTKKFKGLKLKKSSGRLLATNWRNIVTKCKFLVASLYNVNDTTHSMARSIRFDCLKISWTKVGIDMEVK